MASWVPDILGKPFAQRTLQLGEDADGPLVATLVRSLPSGLLRMLGPLADVDVLYVHGWSDYFFQRELARFWNRLGARFYALDLRRYGRSLRPGQAPGYITSLSDYDADISAALDARAGHARVAGGVDVGCPALVLLSRHSTSPMQWSDQMTSTDSVLVVDDIARTATRIGNAVTVARIDGAIHDVFLSAPAPRDAAYSALERWLVGPGIALP